MWNRVSSLVSSKSSSTSRPRRSLWSSAIPRYSSRSSAETVSAFERDHLVEFHGSHFSAHGSTLIVCGAVEPDELYGITPLAKGTGADHGLRPVMTLSCRLLAINTVEAGEVVGYGGRYRCPERMRIGVAGIGYGDGYPRGIPDGTPVLLNGRRASVAGRVSMDLLTLDLRGHDDAQVGDEVVLWGDGLPVEEIARGAGMIPYELVCGITNREASRAVRG